MDSKLVSVIIPMYNSENSIEETLKSVMNQTYKNIEILIIDNNSTDNSNVICQKYAKNDNRIHIYIEKKQGQSFARNLGIKMAKGDFIYFVDADDVIIDSTIKTLISESNREYLIGIRRIDNKQYNDYFETISSEKLKINIINGKQMGCIWVYLFETEIIKEKNILFDTNTNLLEDMIFLFEYLKFVSKVKFINQKCYYYRLNKDSTTKKTDSHTIINNIIKFNYSIEKIKLIENDNYIDELNKKKNFGIMYELNKVKNKKKFNDICNNNDCRHILSTIKTYNIIQKKYYKSVINNNYFMFNVFRLFYKTKNRIKKICNKFI